MVISRDPSKCGSLILAHNILGGRLSWGSRCGRSQRIQSLCNIVEVYAPACRPCRCPPMHSSPLSPCNEVLKNTPAHPGSSRRRIFSIALSLDAISAAGFLQIGCRRVRTSVGGGSTHTAHGRCGSRTEYSAKEFEKKSQAPGSRVTVRLRAR